MVDEQLEMIEIILRDKVRLFSMKHKSYYEYKKDDFLKISYGRWAIGELLNYIYERVPLDVVKSVEEFRSLMDYYVCISESEEASIIFLHAYDIATLVLDELIILGYYSYEEE